MKVDLELLRTTAYLTQGQTAELLGIKSERLKGWMVAKHIPEEWGPSDTNPTWKVPSEWVLGILEGSIKPPEDGRAVKSAGILKVRRAVLQAEGKAEEFRKTEDDVKENPPMEEKQPEDAKPEPAPKKTKKVASAYTDEPLASQTDPTKSEIRDTLRQFRSKYGSDVNQKIKVFRRNIQGAYVWIGNAREIPDEEALLAMKPQGGDFKLQLFRGGKLVDEADSILVEGDPSMADDEEDGGFPRRFGGGPRQGPTFVRRPGWEGGPSPRDEISSATADLVRASTQRVISGDGGQAAVLRELSKVAESAQDAVGAVVEEERKRTQDIMDRSEARLREERERHERRMEKEGIEAERRRKEEKEALESKLAHERSVERERIDERLKAESARAAEAEQRRRDEKEALELRLAHEKVVDKDRTDERLKAEQSRHENMMKLQQDFFSNMREIDVKRQELADKARAEERSLFDRQMAIQKEAVAEQRDNNQKIFDLQMKHLEEMKKLDGANQPIMMVAEAVSKGLEKFGPMIEDRLSQRQGFQGPPGRPGSSLSGPAQRGRGIDMSMVKKIKGSEFFREELVEIARKIQANVPPAFTVNKLMGAMQADGTVGYVLDYVVTRSLREVTDGVALDADVRKLLDSPEAETWWTKFKQNLIQAMTPPEQG